jgi:O-antigen/teichoic acid export membrane protein
MPLLFRASMLRTLQTTVNIIVGLFMLPFMISILGEDLYGIWILIGGFTASLHLMDFGFASAVTRFVVRYLTEKEYDEANEVISSALVVYIILGLLVAIVTLIIAVISDIWISNPENVDLVFALITITGLSLAIEFPFKAFAGVSIAYMRHDLNALSQIIIKVISTVVSIFLLLQGYELIAIALVGLGSSLLSNIVFVIIARRLFQDIAVSLSRAKRDKIKQLSGFSFWAFLTDISSLLNKKMDIFMIGAFLGLSTLTIYYVSLRLVEYTILFLGRATGITMPIFTKKFSENNTKELNEAILIFVRINLMLGCYAVFMAVFFGRTVIEAWMGSGFNVDLAYYSLCVLISGKILLFIFGPLASALMALNKHQWLSYLGLTELSISAVVIYLAIGIFDLGILGASFGAVVPLFVTRFLVLPIIVEKKVGLKLSKIYSNLYRPFFCIIAAVLICIQLRSYIFTEATVLYQFYFSLVASIVYWVFSLSALTSKEWTHLFKILPERFSNSWLSKTLTQKRR